MDHFLIRLLLTLSLLGFSAPCRAGSHKETLPPIPGIFIGMPQGEFVKTYPKIKARTYRQSGREEWMTFNEPLTGKPHEVVSFHLQDGKIKNWRFNDRGEVITEYLGEFCSMAIAQGFPKIYDAIRDVLQRMPFEDFLKITDRRRPVLFTEFFDSGTAKFASSSEIISTEDDAPAFMEGVTIIKLSTGLNQASGPEAIEGVLAHELAHRVLDHVRKGRRTCQAEREANALIKQWGFGKEYEKASATFGQKVAGKIDACPDK